MKHATHVAQYVILSCFLLFVVLLALSAQMPFAGKATTATTVRILPTPPLNCSFSPQEGYNIVALPCLIGVARVDNITNNTGVLAMYQYVPGSSDPWRVYNPSLPDYVVNDLTVMTRRVGYITIMNASANKEIVGGKIATDIPVAPGWNLIGYPTNETKNATIGLALINGTYTQVVTYNKSTESFVSFPDGALVYLIPGEGYWINVSNATTWSVD
jgi:hypothetical protein